MGTSTSADELARKLRHAAKALSDNRLGIEKTAFAGKQVFVAELATSGVDGTTRISRGVKARYDVKGGTHATALLRYTGPAHLLNNPTTGHDIRPRRRGRRGRGGKRALSFDGVAVASARHPGTPGLKFFERARAKFTILAPRVYQREGVREPLRRLFR